MKVGTGILAARESRPAHGKAVYKIECKTGHDLNRVEHDVAKRLRAKARSWAPETTICPANAESDVVLAIPYYPIAVASWSESPMMWTVTLKYQTSM